MLGEGITVAYSQLELFGEDLLTSVDPVEGDLERVDLDALPAQRKAAWERLWSLLLTPEETMPQADVGAYPDTLAS